jgi:hypothetical protein
MRFMKSGPVKFGLLGLAAVLWLVGLADQMESAEMTAGYLALSAAIIAVALV